MGIFHHNYKSDISVIFRFPEGRPGYPWKMLFTTRTSEGISERVYEVWFDGDKYSENCIPSDDSSEHVSIQIYKHGFRPGRLCYELRSTPPDVLFPENFRVVVAPKDTNVEFISGPSDTTTLPDIAAILPAITRGESAYEVAVRNGFEGTEEEWLKWLHNVPIVQEPGDIEDAVMSQKSTTELAAQTLTNAKEYTDIQIAAIPDPDVDGKIAAHNTSGTAHEDIRAAILAAMQKFADYYTKSETYTKAEVNEQIAELSTARFEVVEVLPDVGETNVIYLLPKAPSEASNAYDEYIYLGGMWEIIGTTEIDLSQYATREWVQQIAAGIQQQIDTKVDKVEGKGLSTNDYTDLDKAEVASIETIERVLAHSDCSLEERVAHLEDLLIGVISGEVYIPKLSVKELGVWGKNNINVTNPGAPTLPPDRIGQFYFDETSGVVYKSTGNASISDWKIL